ncbi:hypothetical protein ACSSS7_005087 [Eimeria intestinalis]
MSKAKRSLARSSGSRHSSSSSRSAKRPSSSSSTRSSSSSRSSSRPSVTKPATAKPQDTQQAHDSSAVGPPPPAYPYADAARGPSAQAPPHGQGMQHPPQGPAAQPAAAVAPAAGGGGPSFVKTAASSAVGAVVGSMAGTALANSLTHRGAGEAVQSQDTSTTTSGPTVTIAPDAAAMTAGTERSSVSLTFSGLDDEKFKAEFADPEAFGTKVRDAVIRALGISADRVVLEDVSVTTTSKRKKTSTVVVRLNLLPSDGLLTSEPSPHNLAEEISRQLSQEGSYLVRELRAATPQLPTALVETIGSKIMQAEAKATAANATTQVVGSKCLYTAMAAVVLLFLS